MDNKKEIELIDLIADVKKGIISAEKEYNFSTEVKELRDSVFLIHAEVESVLEMILIAKLFKAAKGNKVIQKDIDDNLKDFIKTLHITTAKTGFAKKLDQVKVIVDLPTKDAVLYQNINNLNTIRVEFAHPNEKKYEKYSKTDERIKAYKILKEVVLKLPKLREFYMLLP